MASFLIKLHDTSIASEVTTLWLYANMFIIIIIINKFAGV